MKTKNLLLISFMVVLSLVVSLLESYIPIPIPGVKLGISNIVIINAMIILGYRYSILISLVKSLILVLLIASPISFFYSFLGALSSITIMYFALKFLNKFLSIIGISVLGSVSHIFTQILVASIFLNTRVVFYYFPILGIIGVFTGVLVGFVSIKLSEVLRRIYAS